MASLRSLCRGFLLVVRKANQNTETVETVWFTRNSPVDSSSQKVPGTVWCETSTETVKLCHVTRGTPGGGDFELCVLGSMTDLLRVINLERYGGGV